MRKLKKSGFTAFTALLLVAALLASLTTAAFAADTEAEAAAADTAPAIEAFADCDPDAWYAPAITFALDNGILKGTAAGTMEPDRAVTRAEFVTMLDRLFGAYNPADISAFTDVSEESWYYNNIALGYQMGTIQGVSTTRMYPDASITREQAICVMARSLALQETDTAVLTRFSDYGDISDWAKAEVAAFAEIGGVNGFTDGTLRPLDNLTRAQAAQILMNLFTAVDISSRTISGVTISGNLLWRAGGDATMTNAAIEDILVLANGFADSRVDLSAVTAGTLLCWGAHDVYIDANCTVNDSIVIARTDGPCIIHWLGDSSKLPTVIFTDNSDSGCMVVDKDGNILLPEQGGGNGGAIDTNSYVYFDPQNGSAVSARAIGSDGCVQPVPTPTKSGYVFGGWYTDSECSMRFLFTEKATAGMTLYGRWYTEAEYEIVQRLNSIAANASMRVDADLDFMATVGESSIPCRIVSDASNTLTFDAQLVLSDGTVVAEADDIAPGETCTELALADGMPAYGNYAAKLVITPNGAANEFCFEAMLYVAYMW